jgi:DNA-binding transcriptional MerR regulator/effector-binding domain-containing protein
MEKSLKLKIGEFARLGQVTVQTLRYYADLDLLRPGEVDPFTGYRYYRLDQLPTLHRILALKDLGLPLDQVKRMVRDNITPEEMRRILTLKQDEIRTQVQNNLDQLERINMRLQTLEHQTRPTDYEINIKHVEAFPVASVAGEVPDYRDVTPLWIELGKRIQTEALEVIPPYLTLCHGTEPKIKLEVCSPLAGTLPASSTGLIHTLPEVNTMVFTTHRGSYNGLIDGYTALWQWVNDHGFAMAGPDREIYLRLPAKGQYYTDPDSLTELQIPITPARGN